MKKRDFMKISVGGAVAMSSLNAKENNAGERVEKLKVPFANPSKRLPQMRLKIRSALFTATR
ncbi:hypothetical protein QM027_11620 [Campylobacter concisus]